MIDKEAKQLSEEEAIMAKYGITRVQIDYYHLGSFRYKSLNDAVAQAKRIANMGPV